MTRERASELSEFRRGVRRELDRTASLARTREVVESGDGFDRSRWSALAAEHGWSALTIPEDCGGLGFGSEELAVVMEEAGRRLLPSPLLATVSLATPLLAFAASDEQKARWLPRIAAGEATATVAVREPDGSPFGGMWTLDGITSRAVPTPSGYRLTGVKGSVLDGHSADAIIVAARIEGGEAHAPAGLFLVEGDAPGLTRSREPTVDVTRPLATLSFDNVELPADARIGTPEATAQSLERAVAVAIIALAAEQVGAAEATLEMAVEYAKTRVQFGRQIGSFQAIKHKCANMLMWVESARSAAQDAAAVEARTGSELTSALREAVIAAKVCCSEALFRCAAENIQIHGGVGFTWEHDAHLYFKRARAAEALFGTPTAHRERLAAMIL